MSKRDRPGVSSDSARWHPQVRARVVAAIYADRMGLSGDERARYIDRQESRVMNLVNIKVKLSVAQRIENVMKRMRDAG